MQTEKQDWQITSTQKGISIDFKLLDVNTDSSICYNCEFDLNIIDTIVLYLEKDAWVNIEINNEIHTRTDNAEKRKYTVKFIIILSCIVILWSNSINISVAMLCEAHLSVVADGNVSIEE
jgi:hypothetical protein